MELGRAKFGFQICIPGVGNIADDGLSEASAATRGRVGRAIAHSRGFGDAGRSWANGRGTGSDRTRFPLSLVCCFVIAWARGDELQRLHKLAGYVIAGLLVVQLIWGFADTTYARFVNLDTIYLRPRRNLGHNPAAGAMVVSLLLTLGATVTTGIMITNGHLSLGEARSRAGGKPHGRYS